ncbi:MAG: hypothetical protein AB7D05_11450, partial [Mangrovibacterium sp.]
MKGKERMVNRNMISACDSFLKSINCDGITPEELAGALKNFNISADRITEASEKLPKHYDLTLDGVRKVIGLYLAEFTDLFRNTDQAQIYTTHPAPSYVMMLVGNAGRESVRIKTPEFVVMLVLRSFFGWKEEISGTWNQSCPHCGMNQMRLFLMERERIASPEVLWNWSLLCDVNRRTGELLQQHDPEILGITVTQSNNHSTEEE